MLNVTKRELTRDLTKAVEFDQSQLFKKIYENEFGTPGGEPYGALIGDYEWTTAPDDVETLRLLSNVAAAGFSPFVSAAGPGMFGFERLHRTQQATRSGQDLRDRGIHEVAQLPRQRGLPLRLPRHASGDRSAAIRREHQADRRIQLRGSPLRRRRRGQGNEPSGLLLDECRLCNGRANDRRVRQNRVLRGHPRRRGRRQGGKPPDARVPVGRRRSRQPSARPRSASPTVANSNCPIWVSCRSATTKTPTTQSFSAARPCKSPRNTIGRKPPPTRQSRHACHTSWRPDDSLIILK